MAEPETAVPVHPLDPRTTFLGHPRGLFLLFLVEMWERFSYYGMRALLVLYLTTPTTGMLKPPPGRPAGFNPGPGWADASANTLFGWYSGLAYLTPVIGGILADRLLGTHRSMLLGGLIITAGHVALAASGLDSLDGTPLGMSVFIFGLALIVVGTGHFKPTVSVMVGQLYPAGDPRRDAAFSIFYMGINVGAFICTFICGTLGELVGWHWGFGAAAVGMLLGLGLYMVGRPALLGEVGNPPPAPSGGGGRSAGWMAALGVAGVALAAVVGLLFHAGVFGSMRSGINSFVESYPWGAFAVILGLLGAGVVAATAFSLAQRPGDRGPVASIFIFMFFNAFFWLAFEQAGSSINLFTDRYTDRSVTLPGWFVSVWDARSVPFAIATIVAGVALGAASAWGVVRMNARRVYPAAVASILGVLVALGLVAVGALQATGRLPSAAKFTMIPTSWFQSTNPLFIIAFAPAFGWAWTALSRRNANPPQPVKIGLGLLLLGAGFVALVIGARDVRVDAALGPADPLAVRAHAAVGYVVLAYFLHTMGELCLSPTGLSYVTKAAPIRFVSLLMGIWFVSSFIANLSAGLLAALLQPIEEGKVRLWWDVSPEGGVVQADFFLIFVGTSAAAGVLILALTRLLRMLMRNPND